MVNGTMLAAGIRTHASQEHYATMPEYVTSDIPFTPVFQVSLLVPVGPLNKDSNNSHMI